MMMGVLMKDYEIPKLTGTLLATNSSPLRNGGWNTILSYWEGNSIPTTIIQGRAVKLRRGIPWLEKKKCIHTPLKTNMSCPLKIIWLVQMYSIYFLLKKVVPNYR